MSALHLEPWSDAGLDVLRRQNTPAMTRHLGGPELEEAVGGRHQRYLHLEDGEMMVVRLGEVAIGSIGYWARSWDGHEVYETGYAIFSEFGGHGYATAALRLVASRAALRATRRHLHAFPRVDHAASNAVCRRAGFELVGTSSFEYPKGTWAESNDWRMDLTGLV
ncbi:GNAT family N-acetyltransferase [Cryobacterium tepidiphilum]|uniref:N-acetyltransferase n=1 Tax=Cryobacterium tepidiphilum TaxID=2486026 RepID=A0A3M8LPG0_9MICO|nr:GNAT family N-acetyltransferase [Cryobacterium tepidiphilum]RNE67380.1 N-acetyltransferase [Cryobacterium tepidiphilum]